MTCLAPTSSSPRFTYYYRISALSLAPRFRMPTAAPHFHFRPSASSQGYHTIGARGVFHVYPRPKTSYILEAYLSPSMKMMNRLLWVAITFLAVTFLVLASFVPQEAYPWPPSASKMSMRPGTLGDLDELVDLVLVTMCDDPQWDYRFEHKAEYPEDHRKYTRMLYEKFLNVSYDDWQIMLVEEKATDLKPKQIVAFSVWDVSYVNKRKHGSGYVPQNPFAEVMRAGGATRKDANPAHVLAFKDMARRCNEEYLDQFGNDQMILQILGTHRDHRRRGHGTALCNWGMDIAEGNGLVTSLVASITGFQLYTHLQFANLGECIMQTPGEETKISFWAMVYPKPKSTL